jgi:hypothetical protein
MCPLDAADQLVGVALPLRGVERLFDFAFDLAIDVVDRRVDFA